MWISARTATTLAAAALLLVMFAVAAPLIPRPHLPSLPEERKVATTGDKLGAAAEVLQSPERCRAQRMSKCDPSTTPEGGARLVASGRYGSGPAVEPSGEVVKRLVALLKDSRTVVDARAAKAEATWVVRLVRDTRKVDVMVDPVNDQVVLALNGDPIGSYGVAGLHREFAAFGDTLFSNSNP